LIEVGRKAFDEYNVMAFCLEAERFVDDRLSNWYVRRNKPRCQKEERDADKLAAFQTLHTVLLTLAKLCAPVMPFLTETMYQNLAVNAYPKGAVPESVHLCEYPVADASLVDEALLSDMDSARRLASLGLAARNAAGIKVRQVVAELRVRPAMDEKETSAGRADRRAVERFSDLIMDELNVKRVLLHNGPALLEEGAKLNTKTQKKFAARIPEAQAAVAAASVATLRELVGKGGPFSLAELEFVPEDIVFSVKAEEGWAGAEDRGTQVAIDTRITPELEAEGIARDMIRLVQKARKDTGLEMEDRIELYLTSPDAKLRAVIDSQWGYISGETLADKVQRASAPVGPVKTERVEGKDLTISLRKV
jgi:isoleucyl-tRNA synthetase